MKQKLIFILLFYFSLVQAQEQNNYAEKIDTVQIKAATNKIFYKTTNNSSLPIDAIAQAKSINIIPGVFVKEYGRGMLANISLRGTDASHTQVVWNGIPINSILNGQTDLNTIYLNNYNSLSVEKGGKTIQYGSGAIGGAVNIDEQILFDNGINIDHQMTLGSFNTSINNTNISYSNRKIFMRFGFQMNQSENNYPFVGYTATNENGAYAGKDFKLSLVYQIDKKHQIYYKSQANWLNREMSRSIYKPDNAKLLTDNQRYLTGWKYQSDKISMQTDFAYLYENYQYFFNKNLNNSSNNRSNVYFLKNHFTYLFNKKNSIKIGNNIQVSEGKGDAIGTHQRKQYAIYAIWKQKFNKFSYRAKLRKEFHSDYNIPFVFATTIDYQANKNFYTSLSASTNYRVPTFNDLYWQPGGNPELIPEKSYSLDITQKYISKNKSTKLTISGFYIKSKDLIKWRPISNLLWQPVNINRASSLGFEADFYQNIYINNDLHSYIKFSYTYQNVKDLATNKKLPYLPAQMLHGNIVVNYKKMHISYQSDFTDKIYTTSTNTQAIDASIVHHTSIAYQFNNHIYLEGKIYNIFNTFYQTFPSRPQPGRNYSLNLKFKIHTSNEKK
jgi:iron complex outermembrane receptor protein